jgi:peptidoglycan/LPS O-acetylase OafA/YrhL
MAVVLVLLFHAGFPVPGGYVGVDVFFVISGFLITKSILEAHHQGRWSLLEFYDHRVRRILPAMLLMLAVCGVASAVIMLPSDLKEIGKGVVATATFGSNIYLWKSSGYFDVKSESNPLLHTWSLGVEEQYYILFPIVVSSLIRFRRAIPVIITVALFSSFALCVILVEEEPSFAFYMLPTRAWELLAGSVLASVSLPALSATSRQLLSGVGLASIATSAFVLTPQSVFPGWSALPPVLGTMLVIWAGPATQFGRCSDIPVLKHVGLMSYSLYLWHWPLYAFYVYWSGTRPNLLLSTLLLLVTFVVSHFSYAYVEQPFRRRVPGFRAWTAPAIGGFALAITAAVGCGFVLARGIPSRLPESVVALDQAADDQGGRSCPVTSGKDVAAGDLCLVGLSRAERRWLLWGDSHAWALQGAFSDWLEARGEGGTVVAAMGCPPLVGYQRVKYPDVDCKSVSDATIQYLERSYIKDVVLIASWTNWFEERDDFVDPRSTSRGIAVSRRVLTAAFQRTVEQLSDRGVRVWLVEPLPQAKGDVPLSLAKQIYLPHANKISYTQEEYNLRNEYIFEMFGREDDEIYARFKIGHVLCASGECAVANRKGPLYFDDNHPAASQRDYFTMLLDESLVLNRRATEPD